MSNITNPSKDNTKYEYDKNKDLLPNTGMVLQSLFVKQYLSHRKAQIPMYPNLKN